MSAFTHSDKAFNSIAFTLDRMKDSADWSVKHLMDEILTVISARRSAPDEIASYCVPTWIIDRFCEDLQRANLASVNYRYRENEVIPYTCVPHKGDRLAPIALAKLLDSVNYQSCEVPNWEETPIAKELVEIRRALDSHIVRNLADYQKAAWSM